MTAAIAIGRLAPAELAPAADLLARAFESNPLNLAAVRSRSADARRRANLHGMRLHLPIALDHGLVLAARRGPQVLGVLIGFPPYGYPFPPAPLGARLRCLFAQGLGVARRWAEVFACTDAAHPVSPHWYLGTLGVEPAGQGSGVGRALLARWLERVEADGFPAYLETDREWNVEFYRRAGFAVTGEDRVLDTSLWYMTRPAPPR